MTHAVHLVTYNVMTPVMPPLRFYGQADRLKRIPKAVMRASRQSGIPFIDVVCVQEANPKPYQRKLTKGFREHGFRYATSQLESYLRPVLGGVLIFSRDPILREEHLVWQNCCDEDALSAKGAVYACIDKPGMGPIHIVSCHFQAWNHKKSVKIRELQWRELETFIEGLEIPPEEPLILAGDTNGQPPPQWKVPKKAKWSHEYSSDPLSNQLMGFEDASRLDCQKTYLDTRVCDCCPREWLDYVGVHSSHSSSLVSSSMGSLKNCRSMPFDLQVGSASWWKNFHDLSDHYPVCGSFTFRVTPGVDRDPSHSLQRSDVYTRRPRLVFGLVFYGVTIAMVIFIFLVTNSKIV